MQIQNINSLVDIVRQEILQKYQPEKEDLYLQTLKAAHINEDDYFSHMVQDDIAEIILDLREIHKNDTETAPLPL